MYHFDFWVLQYKKGISWVLVHYISLGKAWCSVYRELAWHCWHRFLPYKSPLQSLSCWYTALMQPCHLDIMAGSLAQRGLLAAYCSLDFLWVQYNFGVGGGSRRSNCVTGSRKGESPETYRICFNSSSFCLLGCFAPSFHKWVQVTGVSQLKLWVLLQLIYYTASGNAWLLGPKPAL